MSGSEEVECAPTPAVCSRSWGGASGDVFVGVTSRSRGGSARPHQPWTAASVVHGWTCLRRRQLRVREKGGPPSSCRGKCGGPERIVSRGCELRCASGCVVIGVTSGSGGEERTSTPARVQQHLGTRPEGTWWESPLIHDEGACPRRLLGLRRSLGSWTVVGVRMCLRRSRLRVWGRKILLPHVVGRSLHLGPHQLFEPLGTPRGLTSSLGEGSAPVRVGGCGSPVVLCGRGSLPGRD